MDIVIFACYCASMILRDLGGRLECEDCCLLSCTQDRSATIGGGAIPTNLIMGRNRSQIIATSA